MSAPWEVRFRKQAKKDVDRLPPKLRAKLRDILLEVLAQNPYEGKKLLKDGIVYSLDEERRIIYIERARTHYGEWPGSGALLQRS